MRVFAIALLLVLAALFAGCGSDSAPPSIKDGLVPDFSLKDLKGNTVSLYDYKGKTVMLEFWTTWCPPCRLAVPELNELYDAHKDDGDFVFFAISMDEDITTVQSFAEEYEIKYPVLFDDKDISGMFGVFSIPTTIFIGPDSKIIKRHQGYAPGYFEELIKSVMAEG